MDKQSTPEKKPNKMLSIIIVAIAVIAIGGGIYFADRKQSSNNKNKNSSTGINNNTNESSFVKSLDIPKTQASEFAVYEPVTVNITPQVPTIEVKDDLSNVNNKEQGSLWYLLSVPEDKNKLINNNFIIQPGGENEFYPLYERHRYSYIPSFVTVDSLLHNYHLLFDYLLKGAEEGYLIPKLKELNASMLEASLNQYNEVKTTDWENAAKRNVGFFAVASVLLDNKVQVPDLVKTEVSQELESINAHDGVKDSIIMNLGEAEGITITTPQGPLSLGKLQEDYSQYVPRGHYDRSDELKAYFKSMMWLGRLTFRLKSPDETRSALLITLLLNEDHNADAWNTIYEPTNFFVGKSDDITYRDLKKIVGDVYGQSTGLKEVLKNTDGFTAFQQAADKLSPPQINSIPVFESSLQSDREKEIKGFRFMGQRFTIDASIMQRLVCRDVGNKHDTMDCGGTVPDSRMTPKGLDVTAAMGSDEAYSILKSMGETEYKRYPENMQLLKDYLAGLNQNTWTQNLYWGWLYALKPLTEPATNGYPSFMQNTAWVQKDLQSYLGSWTELKHDTILYAKQVYAEMGGGPPPQYDDRGYVEPRPDVFARLAALTKMTREGLSLRNLISNSMKDSLDKMESLSLSLKTISEKELNNVSRTDEEYELIRSYGGQLEHFWLEVNKEDMTKSGQTQDEYLNNNPAAIVADVATDPNGTVIEEATGKIDTIYVLVEVEGVIKIAQGGVYSYYEFPWPLSDRLTDKKWRELLSSDQSPKRPDWTSSFLTSQ